MTWIVARDGASVKQALTKTLDLIILDVVMPCMDGFEACRELRRLEATRAIPDHGHHARRRRRHGERIRGRLQRLRDQAHSRTRAAAKVRNLIGE